MTQRPLHNDTWRKEYPSKICKWCGKEFSRSYMEGAHTYKRRTSCGVECAKKLHEKVLREGFNKKYGKIECQICKKEFQPKNQVQRYCGSKKHREGCSWKYYIETKNIKLREYRLRKANWNWSGNLNSGRAY